MSLDPSRAPWFMDAAPGLLTSKLVRTYLSQYSQQLWPLVVKLTLLHGIQSIQQQFQGTCLTVQQLQQLVESGACGLAVQKTIPALQRQILSLQQELDTVFEVLDGEAAPLAATAAAAAPARPARHTWQSMQPPAEAVYNTPVPPPQGPESSSMGGAAAAAATPADLSLLQRLQQQQQQPQRVPVPPGAGKQRARPRRRSSSPILAPKPSGQWRAGEATGYPSPPRPACSPVRRSLDNQGATNPIYPDWWGDPTPRPEPPAPPPPQQRPPPRLAYTYRPTAKAPSVLQDDLVTAEYLMVPGSGYGQHNEPLVPGDGPALTTLTLLPQAHLQQQQQQQQGLGGAAAAQPSSQGGAASGGGTEWGGGGAVSRPRKVVRYSDQSDLQQGNPEGESMRGSSAGGAQVLSWTQQQQQQEPSSDPPAPAAAAVGVTAAGGGRLPLRRSSSSQKGSRGPRLWAVESRIKADVAASKQQAAARRAARQRAFQEAMSSSLTFPQLRSSVEQAGGHMSSSSAAGGPSGAPPAGATPGGAGGSSSGPLSIAERFLSNPLSAWFLGDGPAPSAAPGVTHHPELLWQPEVAWGASGGGAARGAGVTGPGSDVSEDEVLDGGDGLGALQDITAATLNPHSSSFTTSQRGVDPSAKPFGAAAAAASSSSTAAWSWTGQQENADGMHTRLGGSAGGAAGARGQSRRRWDEVAMGSTGGGPQASAPPPGSAPYPQQQQQRRPAWAADYGHLDTAVVIEEVAEQQEEAAEAQAHGNKGGVWVGDFGHLEGPRFSRETAFKLVGRAASPAGTPGAAGAAGAGAPGTRGPAAGGTLPAGTGAAGLGAGSGLFLSHSELQELVTGAMQQAADLAGEEGRHATASTTAGAGGRGGGGRAASITSTPQRSHRQQEQEEEEEEEEALESSAYAGVAVGGGLGSEQGSQQRQRDRTASWAAQLGGEEEEQQDEEEEEEDEGEEEVEEDAAASAAQMAAVQARLDMLLARLQPTGGGVGTGAAAGTEAPPPLGASRPVDAEQLQERLAEAAPGQFHVASPASSRSSVPPGVAREGRPSPRLRAHQQQQQQQQTSRRPQAPPAAAGGAVAGDAARGLAAGTVSSSVRGSGSIDTALLQMVSEELVVAGWRPEEQA